jgi:uncharacterized membrane protein
MTQLAPAPVHSTRDARRRFDRLIAFSDGVFAFAATLLVTDLRPPVASAAGYEAALGRYLVTPGPFVAMAIGFLVVGSYWSSHRGIFGLLREADGLVVWTNLIFLFWVAIQPFFTAALAEHEANLTSVVAYATCQLLAGVAQLGLWAAVLHDRSLLRPTVSDRRVRYVTIQLIRAPAAFLASIPITLAFGPTAGTLSWGLLIVFAVLIQRAFRDLDVAPATSAEPSTAS